MVLASTPEATSAEAFLLDFHDRRPGGSSRAFGVLPMASAHRRIGSSYDALIDIVNARPRPLRVLDLACGDGHLLARLAAGGDASLQLSGVDMSAGELGAARRQLGDAVDLMRARAQALPFASASFEVVICHMALMLMDDVNQVLAEVHRVLVPGGTFAAVVGAMPPETPALTCYRRVLASLPRRPSHAEMRFGDPRVRTEEGLKPLFDGVFGGLSIEDFHTDRRLTPEAMWDWFLELYDLYRSDEQHWAPARDAFMACAAPHVDGDGHLSYAETYRLLSLTTRSCPDRP